MKLCFADIPTYLIVNTNDECGIDFHYLWLNFSIAFDFPTSKEKANLDFKLTPGLTLCSCFKRSLVHLFKNLKNGKT